MLDFSFWLYFALFTTLIILPYNHFLYLVLDKMNITWIQCFLVAITFCTISPTTAYDQTLIKSFCITSFDCSVGEFCYRYQCKGGFGKRAVERRCQKYANSCDSSADCCGSNFCLRNRCV